MGSVQHLQQVHLVELREELIEAHLLSKHNVLRSMRTECNISSLFFSILPKVCWHQHKKQIPPNYDRHSSNTCSNV